jgi:diaminohydroxyphosphoribosylaminopyrimidine deaminase/5-amino-6-(5-phosphoribosylamino)uracil reductase
LVGHQPNSQPITRETSLGRLDYWCSAKTRQGTVNLTQLMHYLSSIHCNEVLIESGAQLAGAFIKEQLIDELIVYMAPTLLGSTAKPLAHLTLQHMHEQQHWTWKDVTPLGDDLRLTLTPPNRLNR